MSATNPKVTTCKRLLPPEICPSPPQNRKLHRSDSNISISSVLSNNPYAPLSHVDANSAHYITPSKGMKAPATKSNITKTPPPIVIHNGDVKSIKEKLKTFKFYSNTNIKVTESGIKFFVENVEQHKELKTFCKINNFKFYSHLLREEQKTKFVIHGLHEMDLPELKSELKSLKIDACDVKKLQIKKRRYDSQCIYLIYFMKAQGIKISQLRETKSICHMIIKWDYFHSNKTGPIQCSNCMIFGHGAENCFMDPKCIRCGETHSSVDCFYVPIDNLLGKIPDNKVKCANCGEQHTANYSKCSKRIQYVQIQEKLRPKQHKTSQHNGNKFVPAPQLSEANFPSISRGTNRRDTWQQPRNNPTTTHKQKQNEDNELLSGDELMEAFQELMQRLKTARTREQQIQAMGQVIIKYCYGSR